MAEGREDLVPLAAEEQQGAAKAEPEGELAEQEEQESLLLQDEPHGSAAASPLSVGEVGIVESIQLENFMCHSRLGPVQFGPNVNFVVGQRGKSALLTALLLGLGGKSLGSPLKEFVKDGEASANILITLSNRGENAYKPDSYGDSIIVHQCISVSGTVSYKLKDQSGSVITSKKAELAEILEHFNIRVDNPMTILQQEMGRQLLQTRSDGERYKFFQKVTQLEQMHNDYLCILERKARTQDQIEQGEKQLLELKQQGIEVEQCFQSMAASRKRLEDLKHEMAWAVVNESERQIEDMISNINIGDQDTIRLNQKLEASQAKFNETTEKLKEVQEKLDKLNKETIELEIESIQARDNINRKKKAYEEAEDLYNSSQNELKQLEKEKEHCNQMENLKKSMEQSKLEKQEKIAMLKEELNKYKDQENSFFEKLEHLQEAIEKDNEEHSRLKREVSDVQQTLNDKQQQLNHLKDCKASPLKIFEPQIPALLEAIDNADREGLFTTKPKGPLGGYIHLQDPEFALAVEACLKDLLLAFCCNTFKDEEVLQTLMKRFYPVGSPRPQIIVSAFKNEIYDMTNRAAHHPEFPTVLTALKIDDAVVANALIDMRGIESVLLIKSNSLARTVMQVQEPPKNCREAFTADGDQVFERRYYSCDKSRPTYLIDFEVEINHLEKVVENTVAQLSVYQQCANSLENDIRKNEETVNNHRLHLKEIAIRVIKINMQIKDLEKEGTQSIGFSTQEKVKEIEKQMEQVEEKMKVQMEEMKDLRQEIIDAEQRHESIKMKIQQVQELSESFRQELSQINLEMDSEKRCLRHYQDRLKHHTNSLQVKKEELTKKEKELEKETAQAKYICPERKEIEKSTAALDKEIAFLKQKIQSENTRHRSREEIIRQFQQIKERYNALDVKVKNLRNCIKSLDQTSVQRYELYQQFRRSLALRCRLYFDSFLSQLALSGEIRFDHAHETLSVRVQRGEGNTAGLGSIELQSGSENSFSNFFFILSLWYITEGPFRCLDAFDSYLDPSSRRIALNMILKIAQSQQFRQFILLTPQSLSFLSPSSLIKIIHVPDTEREQRTLHFRRVREDEEED
ncbi:structural maintenance of chromosomes protein 6-like [Monodelphis domestica]|uniref:Rad50/SbcC-type AAA domain-containing protein n=1 Tax=Monodelphis domestica TaxID=13616 RepID=F6X9P7_MONDO|nr:structural maintenance of chromosomes protein 6-like [Monodelphis domestica]